MANEPEEVTLDVDALDAAAAGKVANGADTGAAVVVDPEVAAATAGKEVVTPDAGIEKLQKQLKAEREARLVAERNAREAAEGEAAARSAVQTSQLDQIKGAIAQVSQANDALEDQYADLMASGDFRGAAKVQRQMGDNSARLAQLEAGKTALERAPKATPRAPTDPIEKYVSTMGKEYPRSIQWVRDHPEFVLDPHKEQQMLAAHQLAMARGYKPDTDDYFKSIEKTLDLTAAPTVVPPHADDPDPMADAAASTPTGGRGASPSAAPVSRSGNGTGSRANTIKLSAAEVEMAQNMGMSVEEYAKNKVALKKEGKLS
jgi:hypothetical protein